MQFLTVSRMYRNPNDPVTLRDVWMIRDEDLNDGAKVASTYLQSTNELSGLHREVAWLGQSLIEFMDFATLSPTGRGRWQHNNYLYFEAINTLRESTIGILNG